MNESGNKNNSNDNKSSIFTNETLGVVLILFATLCLVCLITRDAIFSVPGMYVNSFLFGCFGIFSYGVVIWTILMGALLVSGKKTGISGKRKSLITLFFILVAFISHVATMSGKELTYGAYLVESYSMGSGGIATTSGGGFCVALLSYLVSALLTEVGSYVILGLGVALTVYAFIVDYLKTPQKASKSESNETFNSTFVKSDAEKVFGTTIEGEMEYPVSGVAFESKPQQKLFINTPEDFALKSKREINKDLGQAIKLASNEGGLNVSQSESQTNTFGSELKSKIDYIKQPVAIDVEKTLNKSYDTPIKSVFTSDIANEQSVIVSDNIERVTEPEQGVFENTSQVEEPVQEIPFFEHEGQTSVKADTAQTHAETFLDKYADVPEVEAVKYEPAETFTPVETSKVEPFVPAERSRRAEIFSMPEPIEEIANIPEQDIPFIEEQPETDIEEPTPTVNEQPPVSPIIKDRRARSILFGGEKEEEQAKPQEEPSFTNARASVVDSSRQGFDFTAQKQTVEEPVQKVEEEKPKKEVPPINREYFRPPFDLLETYAQTTDTASENHQEKMEIIQRTLEDFHINAVPQSFVQGPSITRYEIMMPAGISVKKVLNYDDDLKMRLASRDGVRIEAPIPGKNLVGIEVANKVKVTVGLKEVLEGMAGKKVKNGSLVFAIGKDLVGNAISDNLAKGPHYLVAGATGSGKSVCLNVMIVSLIMRYSPEELRLILVDPKRVGFRCYEHLPHLMIDEIVTEPKKALAVLQWAYNEMERRYKVFEESTSVISDIDAYNEQVASDTVPKMPRIVVIVDELADLMETCKKDMEAKIRAIAQKARAAGIHLVLATQRPSVDIITGTIKANLPSRIALKVMNFNDSQTILGEAGAEKLLGNGDMLYKNSSMPAYERYQGAWISDREINNVVSYIKEHNKAYFDDELKDFLEKETNPRQDDTMSDGVDAGEEGGENNELFLKALYLAVNTQTVSISQLQRRFQIGYARAGGLVDKMERMGFVSGNEGSKARRVLLSKEEFENRFGTISDI